MNANTAEQTWKANCGARLLFTLDCLYTHTYRCSHTQMLTQTCTYTEMYICECVFIFYFFLFVNVQGYVASLFTFQKYVIHTYTHINEHTSICMYVYLRKYHTQICIWWRIFADVDVVVVIVVVHVPLHMVKLINLHIHGNSVETVKCLIKNSISKMYMSA